tara:strand:- start:193 stop:1011 length:819 start_codon:yes stop_codon:yes gene_type:complete
MLLLSTYVIKNSDYSLINYLSLFLISFFSNTFSAISGGGAGLIQLPALILFGIPYYQALATHKLATVALGIGGSIRNRQSLKKDYLIIKQILVFGSPGVCLGASMVEFISEKYLYLFLGLLSIVLALYSYRKSELGLITEDMNPAIAIKVRFAILIFCTGVLNGSLSSGTGLIVTILLIKIYGLDFLRAISLTFFSVGIFWNALGAIFLSKIGWVPMNLLLVLILGSFLGGYWGAHLSNLKGNKLIKKTFNLVCLLIGFSLLIKFFNNLYLA